MSDVESDISQAPQWTPPTIQEINVPYDRTARTRGPAVQSLPFAPALEATATHRDSLGSTSSRSDSSESEHTARLHLPTHRNPSSRRFFVSKPIHPLSFPVPSPTANASDFNAIGSPDFDVPTPYRDTHRLSSGSSNMDSTDMSEPFESEMYFRACNLSDGYKCGSCGRLLSQRSPLNVQSGDLPVAGVLSCHHVFHADCLEHITSKLHKSDPPCPLCAKLEDENSPDRRVFNRWRSGFPRLRPFSDDGPSKPWAWGQVGDCVEGALHAPPCNSMLLLNRNRLKKNLSMKGSTLKEFPGKIKRGGLNSSSMWNGTSFDQTTTGCLTTAAGPSSVKL